MKKKSKYLIVSILIVALMTTLCVAFAGCGKAKKYPLDELSTFVTDAWMNTYVYDNSKPLGFDFDLGVNDAKVQVKGLMDQHNVDNTKIEVSLSKGEDKFSVFADSKYLYIGDYRYEVNLGSALEATGGYLAESEAVQNIIGFLKIAFDSVFTEDGGATVEIDKKTYIISGGNLDMLLGLLGEQLPALGLPEELNSIVADIVDTIASADIEIEYRVEFTDKEMTAIKSQSLSVVSGDIDVNVSFNKAAFGNDVNPASSITIPDKEWIDESIALNLQGSVSLMFDATETEAAYSTTIDYELRLNGNIVDVIKGAISTDADGNIQFDFTKIFESKTIELYFDLSHVCNDTCGAFCKSKFALKESSGSFLSLAYSPEAFGSNLVYIDISPWLIPQKTVTDITGLALVLANQVKPRIDLTLEPNILIENLGLTTAEINTQAIETASATAVADSGLTLPLGNIIDMIMGTGLIPEEIFIDVKVDMILPDGITLNIPTIINQFTGGAQNMNIKVDTFELFNADNEDFDIVERYITADKATGTKKEWKNKNVIYNVEYDTVSETNDNLKLYMQNGDDYTDASVKAGTDALYNEDGTMKPLSAKEWQHYLLEGENKFFIAGTGVNMVTGEEWYSRDNEYAWFVTKVLDVDWTLKNQPQTVRLVLSMNPNAIFDIANGFSIADLSMLIDTLNGINGAGIVEYTLTIADEPEVATSHNISADNEYKYGDEIDTEMTITATYGDVVKTIGIQPNNLGDLAQDGKVIALNDVTLKYSHFLGEFSVDVKIAEHTIVYETNTGVDGAFVALPTTVDIKVGEEFSTGNIFKKVIMYGSDRLNEEEISITSYSNFKWNNILVNNKTPENEVEFVKNDLYSATTKFYDIASRKKIDDKTTIYGSFITFKEAGTYTVDFVNNKGIPFKVTFNVTAAE